MAKESWCQQHHDPPSKSGTCSGWTTLEPVGQLDDTVPGQGDGEVVHGLLHSVLPDLDILHLLVGPHPPLEGVARGGATVTVDHRVLQHLIFLQIRIFIVILYCC